MSQNVVKIKSRIKSVSGAYKVTSAMKLVSTVKLKQWKNKMLANKEYNAQLAEVVDLLLMFSKKEKSCFITPETKSSKKLYIIVSSTLGLCGSYNNNIFKIADASITEKDEAIILGEKGLAHYADGEFKQIEDYSSEYSINSKSSINSLSQFIIDKFSKGEYSEVHIIYSEYKNSLVFLAKDYQLLPLKFETNKKENGFSPIMEPNKKELIDTLIPFYVRSALFSKLLESEVCEQGARSNAMENATNNAKDLLEDLQIEFNKARQAAITQEITEIVAAAKAV